VEVAEHGLVMSQRRVVVAEENGKLIVSAEATEGDSGESIVKRINFKTGENFQIICVLYSI
jgi:hypothetical protein